MRELANEIIRKLANEEIEFEWNSHLTNQPTNNNQPSTNSQL